MFQKNTQSFLKCEATLSYWHSYCISIRHGLTKQWKFFIAKYQKYDETIKALVFIDTLKSFLLTGIFSNWDYGDITREMDTNKENWQVSFEVKQECFQIIVFKG